jgi:hypothetical protein
MTAVAKKEKAGVWGPKEGGHLAVFRIGVGGAMFHVWKHSKWTDEQIAKAREARPGAYYEQDYAVRWMPGLQSDATMISYKDWLNEDVNLRLVWLHQVTQALMTFGGVNRTLIGAHWGIEGVDINYI